MSAKFIIIGIDGADGAMLDALSLNGELPNLSALRKKGYGHKLTSDLGSTDDSLWASFQYAIEVSEHGRYHYEIPLIDDHVGMAYQVETLPTFWGDISNEGKRVAVLDIPKCGKPVPVNGIHLVDWLTHGEYFSKPLSAPPALAQDVLSTFGRPAHHQCGYMQPALDEAQKADVLANFSAEISMKCAAGLHYLNSEHWDFFAIGFREAHCCNHTFWDLYNTDQENPVTTILYKIDVAVGELIAAAGPSAEIIVFTPTTFELNGTLEYFMPEAVQRINRALCANHPALFQVTGGNTENWPCAILPHGDNALALRIKNHPQEKLLRNHLSNLPDSKILDIIEKEFMSLKGDDKDENAIETTTRPSSKHHGLHAKNMPDLLIHYRSGYFPKSLSSQSIGRIEAEAGPWRKGNHTNGGFLLASGPVLGKCEGNIKTIADIGKVTKTALSSHHVQSRVSGEKMSNPLVSVIIPYFNAGEFIEEALACIRRQSYSPIEIIIIDDGSSDDIALRAPAWGKDVTLLRQENQGPAAARNRGIKHAHGDIIAFLDADDLWPEGKLALQLKRLHDQPELDMVSGRIQYLDLPGAENVDLDFEENNTLRHVHLGATLIRRRVFDIVGLFDETMRFHEDVDWYMRVRELNLKLAIMKNVTLIYRRHHSNMTRGENMHDAKLLKMLKLSIDRRRAMHGKATNLKPFSEYDDAD
jgi:predicted AlkP superfamily phosphohydrolase/phosphomutase